MPFDTCVCTVKFPNGDCHEYERALSEETQTFRATWACLSTHNVKSEWVVCLHFSTQCSQHKHALWPKSEKRLSASVATLCKFRHSLTRRPNQSVRLYAFSYYASAGRRPNITIQPVCGARGVVWSNNCVLAFLVKVALACVSFSSHSAHKLLYARTGVCLCLWQSFKCRLF